MARQISIPEPLKGAGKEAVVAFLLALARAYGGR